MILQLLGEKPSYGYELIKQIEERLAGGYAPSPGVIYPTLTLLEEQGLATVSSQAEGRKIYALTDAGRHTLEQNKGPLRAITERIEQTGRSFHRGRAPQILRAFLNLRLAVKRRVSRETLSPEQIQKIAAAIEEAARVVDELS